MRRNKVYSSEGTEFQLVLVFNFNINSTHLHNYSIVAVADRPTDSCACGVLAKRTKTYTQLPQAVRYRALLCVPYQMLAAYVSVRPTRQTKQGNATRTNKTPRAKKSLRHPKPKNKNSMRKRTITAGRCKKVHRPGSVRKCNDP